ncbi:hypothetical protein WDU94_002174 [Cyamophila willieti]
MSTTYSIDATTLHNTDEFQFQILHPSCSSDLEESLLVLRQSFFPLETVHRAVKASENPLAIDELEQLCRKTAQDSVSVIAREKSTGKICATAFCKIQIKPSPGNPGSFDEIAASFKQPESLAIMDYMIQVDGKVDLFGQYSTDTLYELMFLGTMPEYCGRHLGKDLTRACLQVASQTSAGAVTILCTSPWTERIAAGLGFDLLYRGKTREVSIEFKDKEGRSYADLFEEDPEYTLRAYPLPCTNDTKL